MAAKAFEAPAPKKKPSAAEPPLGSPRRRTRHLRGRAPRMAMSLRAASCCASRPCKSTPVNILTGLFSSGTNDANSLATHRGRPATSLSHRFCANPVNFYKQLFTPSGSTLSQSVASLTGSLVPLLQEHLWKLCRWVNRAEHGMVMKDLRAHHSLSCVSFTG